MLLGLRLGKRDQLVSLELLQALSEALVLHRTLILESDRVPDVVGIDDLQKQAQVVPQDAMFPPIGIGSPALGPQIERRHGLSGRAGDPAAVYPEIGQLRRHPRGERRGPLRFLRSQASPPRA